MVRRYVRAVVPAGVACAAVAVGGACSDNGPVTYQQPVDASAYVDQLSVGAGIGQPCSPTAACRIGLVCNASVCAPAHAGPDGTPCTLSAECKAGDYCGPQRTCAPAGTGAAGATCASDADCASGFRCDLVGFSAQCQPEGTVDLNGACKTPADCFGGLTCTGGACVPLPVLPPGQVPPIAIPSWPGVTCADDPGDVTAYFRVPRGSDDGDFFRLPFPNDVRMKGGHPSLGAFPTPGSDLLGYDVVARYVNDIQANADGFSTYPTVTMRFSGGVSFDSLKKLNALTWLEFETNGSAQPVGFEWTATTGANHYVCGNSLSARPQPGLPLRPGFTYAFVVSTDVVASDGKAVKPSDDLTALLGGTTPTDPAVGAVYAAYKPLRDWATANGGVARILNATVFTTAHVDVLAQKVVTAVQAATPPTLQGNWTKCDGATPSPCPQADGDRACGGTDPMAPFDEFHAMVTLPIFQKGNEPYATPDDGGDINLDGSGTPQVVRIESVCAALTLPKGATGLLPMVIYAHGTGGSFRSHVTEGVAALLTGGKGIAVLGIDQVEHGTRRGTSKDSPDNLFFNFSNPGAARGNPMQGAADQASLTRLAATLTVPKALLGSAADVKFGSLGFWGHSQGATVGAIALPRIKGVLGAVLSGEGGSLVDALVTKKSPVDIADALPFALQEPSVDVYHPVLALFQAAVDPADPVNHADSIANTPIAGVGSKHVFQPYGLGDTYAPPATQAAYAIAAHFGIAAPPASVTTPDSINGGTPVPVPASANMNTGAPITAFVREYQPGAYDGHFVVFKDPDAQVDVSTFLADVVNKKVPSVGH